MEHIPLNFLPSYPPLTQIWSISTVALSLLVDTHYLKPTDLIFSPSAIFTHHNYWRLITCFLYMGPLDLNLLISLYNVMAYSRQLEEGFDTVKDYAWFLISNCVCLVLYAMLYKNHYFLGSTLIDALMCYWARQNPELPISVLLGLLQFRAGYFGLVNIVFSLILKIINGGALSWGAVVDSVAGAVLGHLMFYLKDVFARLHGFDPLQGPWKWGVLNRAGDQVRLHLD